MTAPKLHAIDSARPSSDSAPHASSVSPIAEIIAELKAGRMAILVDEEHRENEGDLVAAADAITPEWL